jgi:very-short-patch-repair endonuclease
MTGAVRQLMARAAKQDGIVSRDDARALGLTDRQFRWACTSNRWFRVQPRAFCTTGLKPTWRQRLRAAVLSAGPDAIVAGASAAALMKWDGFPEKELALVLPREQRRALEGVTIYRTRRVSGEDVWRVDGFPCTKVARTLADVALTCSDDQLVMAINFIARRSDIERLRDLRKQVRALPGRNVGRVVDILETRIYCADGPEPGLETSLLRILTAAGFKPSVQFRLRDEGRIIKRFDFAFSRERVAIEVDSVQFHSDPEQKAVDETQRSYARMLGWEVLEATAADVRDPALLLEQLSAALERSTSRTMTCGPMPTHQLDLLRRADQLQLYLDAICSPPPPPTRMNDSFFANGSTRVERADEPPEQPLFEPPPEADFFTTRNPMQEDEPLAPAPGVEA